MGLQMGLDIERCKSTCIEVFKNIHRKGPDNLRDIIQQNEPVCHTRSGETLMPVCPRTKMQLRDMNSPVRSYHYWKKFFKKSDLLKKLPEFKTEIKQYQGFLHVR